MIWSRNLGQLVGSEAPAPTMNEQQLQQILTIQQAIAAAATAAVINSLLNPQQAATLAAANALQNDPTSNDLQQQLQQQLLLQQQSQQQQPDSRQSPATSSPVAGGNGAIDLNSSRIQDLFMQLQQQASLNNSNPAALNLNLGSQQQQQQQSVLLGGASPARSPISRLSAQELAATSSNTSHSAPQNKKLKTKHHHQHHHLQQQQQQQNLIHNNSRSSEATSKPLHHSTPKNHSSLASLSRAATNAAGNNTNTSSSSSAFLPNNVGLPRKLVRGQDVWLGRGAEQTRQILKCMWCGQSFKTLAEMTQHMKITQHYTNIISQEQITSWRQPDGAEPNNKAPGKAAHPSNLAQSFGRALDDNHDEFSDREGSTISNSDEPAGDASSGGRAHKAMGKHERDMTAEQTSKGNRNSSGSAKPSTRSQRRESECSPPKSEPAGERQPDDMSRGNSPATSSSSSSQHRRSVQNLILGELDENSQGAKERGASNGTATLGGEGEEEEEEPDEELENKGVEREKDDSEEEKAEQAPEERRKAKKEKILRLKMESSVENSAEGDAEDQRPSAKRQRKISLSDDGASEIGDKPEELEERTSASEAEDEPTDNGHPLGGGGGGGADQPNDTSDPPLTPGELAAKSADQKGDTGDPLSALETMVEKSFDPRLRPGVASGGILQRLGIDEEVCPPWQHINYANWYAACYGHPMAAALLAAGMNLQNGIKLNKNLAPKKNDD